MLLIFLDVRLEKLNEWVVLEVFWLSGLFVIEVMLVVGIWWLFRVIRLKLLLKLWIVILEFLLFIWLMDILVICCSDLVRLVFGNLFMFLVEMVLIILVDWCFMFIDCDRLLWMLCILIFLIVFVCCVWMFVVIIIYSVLDIVVVSLFL